MKSNRLVEEAMNDPSRIYSKPHDVLRDRRLNDTERLEILTSWERETRAEPDADDQLRQVVEARLEIEERLPSAQHRDKPN
jgi:hypothetical protein